MTVQEAVQLVLQASVIGRGSEIFVLDMGEPVRIMDLAADMIRQAGFIPNEDIEIRVVGLRPGEKLFEELSLERENILPTSHSKIKIFQGPHVHLETIQTFIRDLQDMVAQRNELAVLDLLKGLIPEYQPWPQSCEGGVAALEPASKFHPVMNSPTRAIKAPDGLQPA